MTLSEIFEADVLAAENEMPTTFTFGGTDYTGSIGSVIDTKRMEDDGYTPGLDTMLVVRLSVFGNNTPPANEGLIVIGTITYRVKSIERSQCGLIVTYGLAKST